MSLQNVFGQHLGPTLLILFDFQYSSLGQNIGLALWSNIYKPNQLIEPMFTPTFTLLSVVRFLFANILNSVLVFVQVSKLVTLSDPCLQVGVSLFIFTRQQGGDYLTMATAAVEDSCGMEQ